jgi:Domain of unknown function (DUF1816)
MKMPGLLDSSQERLRQRAWWLKIQTDRPCCIYYFGPFNSAIEAQTNSSGYVEDLESESAQGISTTIELYQPQLLTIDCEL